MSTIHVKRIFSSGQTSCAITLPLGWVRFLGLRPGDELEIIANGDLTIRPRQRVAEQTIEGMLCKGIDNGR